jgi:hypothetical protein
MGIVSKDVFKDTSGTLLEQRIRRKYSSQDTLPLQLSSMLDFYRINYFRNLRYILNYTGMSQRTYEARVHSSGVRSASRTIRGLHKGTHLGFDLLFFGVMAMIFSLPMQLLINYDIEEKEIDLQKYGLYKDMYIEKRRKNHKGELLLVANRNTQIAKAIRTQALKRISHPKDLIDAPSVMRNKGYVKVVGKGTDRRYKRHNEED